MRPKVLLSLLFAVGLTTLGHAQDSITLTFPDDGEREVWVQTGSPSTAPKDVVKTGKSVVEVNLNGKSGADIVYVWDRKVNALAFSPVSVVKLKGNWSVEPAAYSLIGTVRVHLEHAGQPLAAGQVELNDGGKTSHSQLLDPSTKGDVDFFAVRPGKLQVTAKYKAKAGGEKSITQILDADKSRPDPIPHLTISIPDDVETVAATASTSPGEVAKGDSPASTNKAPAGKSKPEEQANPIGSILVYVVGLGFAVGIALLGLRYAKQNQDLVQDKLQQLGVDIPKPGDDPVSPDPVPAPMPKKPEPPQKIILDAGASDLSPVSAAPIASPIMVATGEPKLVGETGDVMNLPEGETVVGREVGLGLSLVGESTVSRRHARLLRQGGDVILTDLGSTNGTYVNGVTVQGSTTLRPGDAVQFGSVRFRYEG